MSKVSLGTEGAVQVFEYRCRAHKGERPVVEAFTWPAVSIVTSGVFGFRSEQRTQLLATGSLLLADPGKQYEVSHEHCGGDRCLIFRFNEAVFDALAGSPRREGRGYFKRLVLPPLSRADAVRALAQRRLGDRGATLGLEQLGLELAALALEHAGAAGRLPLPLPGSGRRARDAVFGAVALLERASGDAEVRLVDLAQSAELSPFHFLRLFKRELGVTPYRYLVQARLRRALSMLTQTERAITDIAYEVGFGDLSNFINAFRREFGCSPRRFRRAAASSSGGARSSPN
jgi:AraC-like DNA-binding protein